MQFYQPNWQHSTHRCIKCKWQGEAIGALLGKSYGEILEILCPQCEKHIALVLTAKVPSYYRKQNEIILDTGPTHKGGSLEYVHGIEKWEKYVWDFEDSAQDLNADVFDNNFNLDFLDSGIKVLDWSIIGKGVGSLKARVGVQNRTLARFTIRYGDVEPFLVSSSLLAVMAQRLVRRLCSDCREEYEISDAELHELGVDPTSLSSRRAYRPGTKPCGTCQGFRYMGRSGIHELLLIDDAVRSAILQRLDSGSIKAAATKQGFLTLRADGVQKVLSGITSVEEVLLATHEDA